MLTQIFYNLYANSLLFHDLSHFLCSNILHFFTKIRSKWLPRPFPMGRSLYSRRTHWWSSMVPQSRSDPLTPCSFPKKGKWKTKIMNLKWVVGRRDEWDRERNQRLTERCEWDREMMNQMYWPVHLILFWYTSCFSTKPLLFDLVCLSFFCYFILFYFIFVFREERHKGEDKIHFYP